MVCDFSALWRLTGTYLEKAHLERWKGIYGRVYLEEGRIWRGEYCINSDELYQMSISPPLRLHLPLHAATEIIRLKYLDAGTYSLSVLSALGTSAYLVVDTGHWD